MAGKANVGVPGKNEPQAIPPRILQPWSIGLHNHSISNGGGASQLGVSDPFHFDNTEAASSIGL
jgi:hypothetical protein